MTPTDVERVYEALAETLDGIGAEMSELFLSKLALLIAHELGEVEIVLGIIEAARDNLDVSS